MSDTLLSERIRRQATDDAGYGRGYFCYPGDLREVVALEQELEEAEAIGVNIEHDLARLREAVQAISRYVEHSARWAPDRIGMLREIGEMCDRALAAEQGEPCTGR